MIFCRRYDAIATKCVNQNYPTTKTNITGSKSNLESEENKHRN